MYVMFEGHIPCTDLHTDTHKCIFSKKHARHVMMVLRCPPLVLDVYSWRAFNGKRERGLTSYHKVLTAGTQELSLKS